MKKKMAKIPSSIGSIIVPFLPFPYRKAKLEELTGTKESLSVKAAWVASAMEHW